MNKILEGSIMAKRIIHACHSSGYKGLVAEGPRGVGKSSYCLQVSKEVYKTIYDLSDAEAYQMVLKTCMFSINDVINVLKAAVDRNEILCCAVWDDSAVHASSYEYFLQLREVRELKSVIETCRTATNSMLLNCCDRGSLLSFLRKSDDMIVTIGYAQSGGFDRIAKGYSTYKLPSGQRRVHKEFEEHFSCFLPNVVYEVYYERRKKYLKEALHRMADSSKTGERAARYNKIRTELAEIELDNRLEKLKKKGVFLDSEKHE